MNLKVAIISFFIISKLIIWDNKCFAQRQADNWMTLTSWLNFGGGNQPQVAACPYPGGISPAANATISDANGNLLFYTDGWLVLNRNHLKMPFHSLFPTNHLNGSNNYGRQNVIITPYPEHDSLYFIFYVGMSVYDNYTTSILQYSIVNMNKDTGFGDVIVQDMPVLPVGENVCLKMNATLHCNKKDIWLVGHLRNSDKYFSIPITSSGISNPVVYSTCNMIAEPIIPNIPSLYGTIKISALGDKLISAHMASNFTEVCNFNNQTGVVSNPKKIYIEPVHALPTGIPFEQTYLGPQCADFSPSGKKIYLTGTYSTIWTDGSPRTVARIFQFDGTQVSEAGLQGSGILLDTLRGVFGAMQLGNDGRIYFNSAGVSQFLSGIVNPEANGLACNFTLVMLPIPSPNSVGGSLPSFVQSYFRYPLIATGNCQFQNISFNIQDPIGVSSVAWNFGDPASGINNTSSSFTPSHIFTTQGIYIVKAVLQNNNGCSADTITKVVHSGPFKVFLGNDTTICQGDSLKLKMLIPGGSNFWSTGSFDSTITIKQPGTYSIRVSLGDCSTTDTIVVSFRNLPQFTLGNDTIVCNNQSVLLSPFPNNYSGATYLWNTNAATSNINVNNAGDYWLQLSDNIGCIWRDSINISFKTLPGYNLGNDTSICQKDTLQLNALVSGATGYLWNMGLISPVINVYQSDDYWCDVSKDGCTYRDSINIIVKPLPIVKFGNDTTICEDKTLLLSATNQNSTYLWQDGNTSDSYLVIQDGQYLVKVTMNSCINRDTINVIYKLKPRFELGSDQLICSGQPILLKPVLDNAWQFLWQDGSIGNTYTVTQPGLFYLTASNECGSTRNEITIKEGLCNVYVPNAFTPNSDNKNDLLKVLGTEIVTEFHFIIYNRYGQVVFETKDKTKGWDGKKNGLEQSNGTYVWVLKYRDSNKRNELLKGSTILIR